MTLYDIIITHMQRNRNVTVQMLHLYPVLLVIYVYTYKVCVWAARLIFYYYNFHNILYQMHNMYYGGGDC